MDPDVVAISERLACVKRIILVFSGKGGVGKSTFAAKLAFGLASMDNDVGLLDIDICGPSVPIMFGQQGHDVHRSNSGWSPVYVRDNLAVMSIGFLLPNADDAVIWRGPRKNGLIKQFLKDTEWGDLDYLVVDAPPGTSDEHLSIVQYLKHAGIDGALVVTTPQEVAMADVRKELSFCAKVGIPVLGVVENMSGLAVPLESPQLRFTSGPDGADMTDRVRAALKHVPGLEEFGLDVRVDVFAASKGGAARMCEEAGVRFLGKVPLDPAIAAAAEEGRSLFPDVADVDKEGTSSATVVEVSASFLAVKAVVDGVLRSLEERRKELDV